MTDSFQKRGLFVSFVLAAGLTALSGKLIHLQLFDDGAKVKSSASRQHVKRKVIPSHRGIIVDSQKEIIARNYPQTDIIIDKYHLKDANQAAFGVARHDLSFDAEWQAADEDKKRRMIHSKRLKLLEEYESPELVNRHYALLVRYLSEALEIPAQAIRNKINLKSKKGMRVVMAKGIAEDASDRVEDFVKDKWIRGVDFEKYMRRRYTAPSLAPHTIGYTNSAGKGLCGIEAYMDDYLKGEDGWREIKHDSRGEILPAYKLPMQPARAGYDVQVTLDLHLQDILEQELDAGLSQYDSKKGTIVLLDPKTGYVLGMASRPHFDLNNKKGVATAGGNYALQSVYEPGSTFKVIAMAGVLDQGLAQPTTRVFCHNGLMKEIENKFEVPDHHPYGYLSFEKVLAKSSNIGTWQFAKQLGRKKFVSYVKDFGFCAKTGIGFGGERKGAMNLVRPVDFSRMSYGYSINVTPLQVAAAYGALANGGKLMRPQLVKSISGKDGTLIQECEPEIVRQAIRPETATRMRRALAGVVSPYGTAQQAAVTGYRVAGKTGTVRKYDEKNGGYLKGSYVVSFAGMLPVDDPRFVCVVVVDNPRTTDVKHYGGTIAAPIFAKVATRVAAKMNIPTTEPIVLEQPIAVSE